MKFRLSTTMSHRSARTTTARRSSGVGPARLYTLEVFLIGGPVPESFAGKVISRTIQIRGDQTLQDLHRAIFEAFDRWDEHAYEFQFGKGPHDPQGKRYVLPHMLDERDKQPNIAGDVTRTKLDSLELRVEQPFGYWFDFGDDWWHQIDVQSIDDQDTTRTSFPRSSSASERARRNTWKRTRSTHPSLRHESDDTSAGQRQSPWSVTDSCALRVHRAASVSRSMRSSISWTCPSANKKLQPS